MGQESLITDEARAMIGMETEPVAGYEVSEHEIRRYCFAVGDLNPLYLDREAAEKSPYGGIVAPPTFYEVPFATDIPLSELRTDGLAAKSHARTMPPLKVTRTMAGGTEAEFFKPIRPGDVLTCKSKLVDIYEREGRSARMVFTVSEATYTNQKGEIVVIARSTSIAS